METAQHSVDTPKAEADAATPAPILLYDGECGLCDRTVQFILRNDRSKSLRFAALQSDTGRAILKRNDLEPPEGAGFDTMVFVQRPDSPQEETFLRSHAALQIGRYLGGHYASLARMGDIFPNLVRDAIYRLVARNRHKLFPAPDACRIPSPEERKRFLP